MGTLVAGAGALVGTVVEAAGVLGVAGTAGVAEVLGVAGTAGDVLRVALDAVCVTSEGCTSALTWNVTDPSFRSRTKEENIAFLMSLSDVKMLDCAASALKFFAIPAILTCAFLLSITVIFRFVKRTF